MKFYPSDWRADPALRMCSFAARGLWVDLMTLMHEADPYGHLLIRGKTPTVRQIAGILGGTQKDVELLLEELAAADVFSKTESGVIFSRRMTRDFKKHQADQANGSLGGNPDLNLGVNQGVNPPDNQQVNPPDNGGDKAQRLEARCQKEESQKEKSEIHPEAASPTIPAPRQNRGPGAEAAAVLPMNWTPNQENLDVALSMGLTLPEAERAAIKFKAYWTTGKGAGTRRKPRSWNTTWVNWISKEANDVGHRQTQPSPTRPARNVSHADPEIRDADMLGILEGLGLDRVSRAGPIDPGEIGA